MGLIPRESIRLMISTSILVCYWLPNALEMPHNLATLLNETTSLRVIGIESIGLWEDKKIFL
jgi:hypothetical protein